MSKTANVKNVGLGQDLTHEDLIVQISQKQDKQAFIELFQYFAPRLKSFLMKGGLVAEMAEEIAQEVMFTVWNKAVSYDPEKASASTWIFTIARNKRIDALRKVNRPEYDPLDPLLEINNNNDHVEAIALQESTNILKDAIELLPEEQSSLITKAFYEDKTHQAIANELKVPLGTVKSRIRLGMERLRHILSGKGIEESVKTK